MNDDFILYKFNYDNNKYNIFNNENNKTVFDFINYNNENIFEFQVSKFKNLEKLSIESISNNYNNFNIHDSSNFSFNNDYDIEKINNFNYYSIFNIFNHKTFLYNKINFIMQSHLENNNIYPLEENDFLLKNLLKKDLFNYNDLFKEEDTNLKIYEEYINNYKNNKIIFKNIFDVILKSN
jgi:hypothetical protein